MKIKHRSLLRSRKLDGIGVGRVRTFPFSADSAYDFVAYDLVKPDFWSRKQKWKDKPITVLVPTLCDWFRDRKRRIRKRNGNVVFTRSKRSALLITTLTPTPVELTTIRNKQIKEKTQQEQYVHKNVKRTMLVVCMWKC